MEKTDVVQEVDFEAAARSGVQRLKKGPVAVAGRYDQQAGRVMIELDSGLEIAFRPQHAQGLEAATPADLSEIEISPAGLARGLPRLQCLDGDPHGPSWRGCHDAGQAGGGTGEWTIGGQAAQEGGLLTRSQVRQRQAAPCRFSHSRGLPVF